MPNKKQTSKKVASKASSAWSTLRDDRSQVLEQSLSLDQSILLITLIKNFIKTHLFIQNKIKFRNKKSNLNSIDPEN